METKGIRQTVLLPRPAAAVFDVWLDPKRHAEFTGMTAAISREIGAEFRIGNEKAVISGRTIELCLNRRIVQSWRISMDGWPPEHDSRLTVSLTEANGQTRMEMSHDGVPAICATPIAEGWYRFYWEPLRRYLEGQS